MTQDEFNDLILDRFEALEKENRALKKQLKGFGDAEELLAKLTIASDQAKSLHDSMMVERKNSAEQSLQNRKLREEQDAEYQARHRNSMAAMQKQVMALYDSQAETQQMLQEIKSGREEFDRLQQSAKEHSQWEQANHLAR